MKKTRELLRNVPDLTISDNLNARLKCDVNLKKVEEKRHMIRNWFTPSEGIISLRRVAYVTIIAAVCLISLGFGAARIIEKFLVQEYKTEYIHEESTQSSNGDQTVTTTSTTYGTHTFVKGDNINNQEDAREAEAKMIQLIKEGEVAKNDDWTYRAVLPIWGEVILQTSLPMSVLVSDNREEKVKEFLDEVESLRRAGKFESVFKKEVEKENGRKVRYYEDVFTLLTGEIVKFYRGRTVKPVTSTP
jgi:hypothetical protein